MSDKSKSTQSTQKDHKREFLGPSQDDMMKRLLHHKRYPRINLAFNIFAKKIADAVGNAITFILALLLVIGWALVGHHFHYSDTWQLIINTSTTIITFLVVFIIQNTQNRDTEILNLKINELIKANKNASNKVIDLTILSDSELKQLEKQYLKIKNKQTGE